MLLQLLQNSLSDPSMWGYIGAGSGIGATAGSIITMGVQKLMSKKKDDADVMEVIIRQVDQLLSQQEFKDKIIEQLQLKSCFREPCSERINGNVTTRKRKVNQATLAMKVGIVLALLLLSFSCKTKKDVVSSSDNYVYDYQRDYLTPILPPKDSSSLKAVFRCDSAFNVLLVSFNELKSKHINSDFSFANGILDYTTNTDPDTVKVQGTDRILYVNKNINHSETITKTVEVERKLTTAQKTLIGLGKILLWSLAFIIVYLLYRFFPWWKKLLKI